MQDRIRLPAPATASSAQHTLVFPFEPTKFEAFRMERCMPWRKVASGCFGRDLAGDRRSVRRGGPNRGWHARPYGRWRRRHEWRRLRSGRPRATSDGATRASADAYSMSHGIRHHEIHVHLLLTWKRSTILFPTTMPSHLSYECNLCRSGGYAHSLVPVVEIAGEKTHVRKSHRRRRKSRSLVRRVKQRQTYGGWVETMRNAKTTSNPRYTVSKKKLH